MSKISDGEIKKLDIQDNDVLLLPEGSDMELLKALMSAVERMKTQPQGVTVICGELDTLSEADMNAAGWYRK